MNTIENESYAEIVINRSRFLSFAYPISSEQDVLNILNDLKKEYKDATHICFGYILNSPRVEKCSDDKEPSGTAGKPLLELLKKRELSDVLLVVVRYFGGIKLGAGGLIRAYTSAGKNAIDNANIIESKTTDFYKIEAPLEIGTKVLSALNLLDGKVVSCIYSDIVTIEFTGDISSDFKSNFKGVQFNLVGRKNTCRK